MKSIAFFNNKGGVGKTTLVYHLAFMMAEQGRTVLAVDLDPQANLTSMFLKDETLEEIWPNQSPHKSIYASIEPIIEEDGDFDPVHIQKINNNLSLIPGDLGLSLFEDKLSDSWPKCLTGTVAPFRTMTSFYRIIRTAAESKGAEIILIDVGPNLGAVNRAALIAAEHIVMPLAPGLFSLQGLRNLGPTLKEWRKGWKQRSLQKPDKFSEPMPTGTMKPTGYIIMQHAERRNRPVKAYQKWVDKIPQTYKEYVLDSPTVSKASHQIGLIKNYQSLMPYAQEARKPIFKLKPAEGAIGAHAQMVQKCYNDFETLSKTILTLTSE